MSAGDAAARRIVLARRPDGPARLDDFRLEPFEIGAPSSDEVLVEVLWLSLDPYMRGRMDDVKSYAPPVGVGAVMEGGGVGRVIASNSARFAPGDIVLGMFGWTTHAVAADAALRRVDPALAPISTALGVLGMPGLTAYVGLNLFGRPKAGETIVVSAATGAVGSVVGQLAKVQGLRVVGVAGGSEKCAIATEAFGFDACVDHRAAADARALREKLQTACPDGVDVYFENVGGKTLEAVIPLMNVAGRVPVCGMISWYDHGGLGAGAALEGAGHLAKVWRTILVRRLQVSGFIVTDHVDAYPAFARDVGDHVRAGRVRYRESVVDGLEAAPQAFLDMLRGGNVGKQLVRIADEAPR